MHYSNEWESDVCLMIFVVFMIPLKHSLDGCALLVDFPQFSLF